MVLVLLSLAVFPSLAIADHVPQQGDYFNYYEIENLGNGTGDYAGYSEHTVVNGTEIMNGVSTNGIVSAHYGYFWAWNNNTVTKETGSSSGNFTFSSTTFLYINGTDNQTGYVNPTVWFCIDNSIPQGGTLNLLNTGMTVISRNDSYYLPSQNRNVNTICVRGSSEYQRNDQYGIFTATYVWNAYFDPSTGYIIGYSYVEHDTNPSGSGFTYTDYLNVNSTSYPLTTASISNPGGEQSGPVQNVGYIVGIVLLVLIVAILIYAFSRKRKTLPKHPSTNTPGRSMVRSATTGYQSDCEAAAGATDSHQGGCEG